jgi:cytochrome c553
MLVLKKLQKTVAPTEGNRTMAGWWPLMMGALLILAMTGEALAASQVELGRRIYEEGILPSGAKLQGTRFDQSKVTGEDASCAKCHRQSGMGSKEGKDPVPPVTGRFLFGEARESVVLTDPRSPKNVMQSQAAYTDAALVKAIRKGINREGKSMHLLMPRYEMDDASIKALTAYLKQLSAKFSPGVSATTIRFATIVAPGVDAPQRDVMLKMMQAAFRQRNSSHTLRAGRTRAQVQADRHAMRKWELAVWELQGTPETWGKQLADLYSQNPVFAVISGVASGTWAPVHEFCNRERVPCLFPSVDLPEAKEGFYSLYFSRGAALEADVLAKQLLDPVHPRPQRVVQVRSDDGIAEAASLRLRAALAGAGLAVEDRVVAAPAASGKNPLEGLSDQDAVVFWLRPADLASLAKATPKLPAPVTYFSSVLADGEAAAIPVEWRSGARLAYPYELGDQRQRIAHGMKQWLQRSRFPLVNERFQSEVYFNLVFLSDITMHMLDNYYRDYLIERTEDMLGQSGNVTVYPRLSLGPKQRFASKGAYIAKFDGDKLVADTEWIVP